MNKHKGKAPTPWHGFIKDGFVKERHLAQQVFEGALLLLERALVPIGSPLGLEVLVPGKGAQGFFGAALLALSADPRFLSFLLSLNNLASSSSRSRIPHLYP